MMSKVDIEKALHDHTFLITGGAGFIGSHIVDYLIENGARLVRVLDNLSTGSEEKISKHFDKPNFEFEQGDIRDAEVCRTCVKGINFVSHQAALGSVPRSVKDPVTSHDVNINGFLNMLIAAKESEDLIKMVYASSSSVYGDKLELPKVETEVGNPMSPYAVTKKVNELYAEVFSKTYDFHTIGLRYFNIFGPHQDHDNPYAAVIPIFMNAVLNQNSPTINGDGLTSRDFTYVANAVEANLRAMFDGTTLTSHEVFNIGTGNKISLNELWKMLCDLQDCSLEPHYGEERPGDIKHSLASIEKAKLLIKYKPIVEVRAGIRLTLKWFSNSINKTMQL